MPEEINVVPEVNVLPVAGIQPEVKVRSIADAIKNFNPADILIPILPLIKPLVVSLVRNYIFAVVKQKNENLYKVMLADLYIPLDLIAEDAAKKTENPFDDFAVDVLMTACKADAEAAGIALPNMDND